MQGPFDQQRAIMAQRMGASTGAPPGGLNPSQGAPPPPVGAQQPLGGAPSEMGMGMGPQPSEAKPLLDQVFQIVIRGNPADMEAVGEFIARLKSMSDKHNMGQGQMQMGAGPPAMSTP